jgi:hypothetical protein
VYPVSGNKPLSLRLKKESAYTYEYLGVNKMYIIYYRVIINYCPIAVRIGDVVSSMCRKPHNMSETSIADRWRYWR